MNDRREPTISMGAADPDAHGQAKRPSTHTRPAQNRHHSAPAVQAKSSPLGAFSFILSLIAIGGAGFVYWQFMQSQQKLDVAEGRIVELEQKLTLTGDESSESLATLQVSLKEAHSEIRKLWGVSYDTNRKAIASNKALIAATKKSISKGDLNNTKKLNTLSAEVRVVSELVDAQQSVIDRVEQSNVNTSAQARAVNEKTAKMAQTVTALSAKVSDAEKDIEAINGFRRSVNQQLIEMKNRKAAP